MPCWGRCVEPFIQECLPHWRAALDGFPHEVVFVLHTDQPEALNLAMSDIPHHCLELPLGEGYERFGMAHNQVLQIAKMGDRISLSCADVIVSKEYFFAMEARFAEGKKAVCGLGHRTNGPHGPAPGISARDLNRWAVDNMHQILKDLIWGEGKSRCPSILFFRNGESMTMRVFGMGPLGLVKDRYLSFNGTADMDLVECYDRSELHIVTSPDELAVITLDEPTNTHGVYNDVMTEEQLSAFGAIHTREIHHWFFTHSIRILGDEDCGDGPIADRILAGIPAYMQMVKGVGALLRQRGTMHGH